MFYIYTYFIIGFICALLTWRGMCEDNKQWTNWYRCAQNFWNAEFNIQIEVVMITLGVFFCWIFIFVYLLWLVISNVILGYIRRR